MPNNITSIVQAGVDAFSNLYEVKIYGPTFTPQGVPTAYIPTAPLIAEARIQDFTPPEPSVEPYDVSYMMVKVTKLKPKIKVEKKLSIPIRVDKNYEFYTKLVEWKKYFANLEGEGGWKEAGPENDQASPTGIALGKIEVSAFKSDINNSTAVAKWIFEDVICSQVGQPSYSREGSNPVTITAEFIFTRMREVIADGPFDKKETPELTKQ